MTDEEPEDLKKKIEEVHNAIEEARNSGKEAISEEDAEAIMEEHGLAEGLPETLKEGIKNKMQAIEEKEDTEGVVRFAEGMKKDMITEDDRKPGVDLSLEERASDLLREIENRREKKENYDALSLSKAVPEANTYIEFPEEKVEEALEAAELYEPYSQIPVDRQTKIYKRIRRCEDEEEAKDIIEDIEEEVE